MLKLDSANYITAFPAESILGSTDRGRQKDTARLEDEEQTFFGGGWGGGIAFSHVILRG